jgi:multiple sugar transport system substrate-binding protein
MRVFNNWIRVVVLGSLLTLGVACQSAPPTATAPAAPAAKPVEQAKPAEAAKPAASGQKIELTFWKHGHPPADEFTKKLIEEYEAKNPNVKINLEILTGSAWPDKIFTAIAGGNAPDIWDSNDTTMGTFIGRGTLAPADPKAFGFTSQADMEKAWVANSLTHFKDDKGAIYGIPFEYNSWLMVINDRLFKEAGLDPAKDYPKTWDEVGTVGAKVAKMKDGKFEVQGFSWNLLTAGWTMLLYSPLVYQQGGSILTDDDKGNACAVNSPEGVKAMKTMQDMYYKHKAGAPGINLSTAQNGIADMQESKVAMWILGPWAIPSLKDSKDIWENYRVVPLPQMTDAKRKTVMLSTWAWAVNAKSPNVQEAWKFIDYASQQGPRWLSTSGYILPRLGWQSAPEATQFRGLDTYVGDMPTARPRLLHAQAAAINNEIHKAAQKAILNNEDAKTVLDAACVEIDKLLKK